MAEQVDARDLKSRFPKGSTGSIPVSSTRFQGAFQSYTERLFYFTLIGACVDEDESPSLIREEVLQLIWSSTLFACSISKDERALTIYSAFFTPYSLLISTGGTKKSIGAYMKRIKMAFPIRNN